MICPNKVRLVEKYTEAARLFSREAQRMLTRFDSPSAFEAAILKTDIAHDKCNAARLALDTHRCEHGC